MRPRPSKNAGAGMRLTSIARRACIVIQAIPSTPPYSLCTAVLCGDSYGLPNEGIPRHAVKLTRRLPLPWRPVSDDSEHTALVLNALNCSGNVEEFRSRLAWGLRWWSLALPVAMGFATARSCARLWFGCRNGVFSAGNGPCMRVPAVVAHAPREQLRDYLVASTTLTHTDPKALWACEGLARALLHPQLATHPREMLHELRAVSADPQWLAWIEFAERGFTECWSPSEFMAQLGAGNGVSGYALHTVPAVIYCWLWNAGQARAVRDVVLLGGDTDSTAALVAALVAQTDPVGLVEAYPEPNDWPVNPELVRRLEAGGVLPREFFVTLLLRNAVAIPVYLAYALVRRLH